MIESLKIVLLCVAAAILYGIIHDQFTARICIQYFTVFHPPIFGTQSPTLLGIGWGVIATWWVGTFLGVMLAVAARAGSRPKLTATALLLPIGKLLITMAACAALSGLLGFELAKNNIIFPPDRVAARLPASAHSRFMADWCAHSASYLSGFLGGIVVCVLVYRRRSRPDRGAL
jgi:hypothetical protein